MILSQENLNAFIEKSKKSNLEVIDGKLIAHKKYKVDVLTYILNKYSKIREIRFFWEPRQDPIKKGVILVINAMIPVTIGLVSLKENKIIISIDGFQFEDDNFNEYILKCNTDEKHEGYIDNNLFGFIYVKSKTGGNLVVLNVRNGDKSLYFNTDSYLETKNYVTQFKIRNCYKINKVFECNEMERLRVDYFSKICEIEKRINIGTVKFEAIIDLKTGFFHFYSKFYTKKETQRKFLEYILDHYISLSEPLYTSIIGNAEEFINETYQTNVILSDKEMIKKCLDLYDMITI